MKNLILPLLFPVFLAAQVEPSLMMNFGKAGSEQFNKVIEASNGKVVAVGQTNSNTSNGTDGYFVIWNPQTNETIETSFGKSKDETINCIVQTYDGFFLMAGSTSSKGAGKKDGWVLAIDEKGKLLWDTTFGTPGDDEFLHMILMGDGRPVLCGIKNEKKEGDVWIVGMNNRSIAWEKNLGKKEYHSVCGIVRNFNGQLVLAGTTDKAHPSREGNIWLLETSPDGLPKTKVYQTYGEEKSAELAAGIITTQDNGYAIVGQTNQNGRVEMVLLKYDSYGQRRSQPFFHGTRNDTWAHCLFQDPATESIYLAGETKRYLASARYYIGDYVKQSPGKDLESNHFGTQFGDNMVHSAIMLHDGSLVFAGYTESKSRGPRDGWLCLFRELGATPSDKYGTAKRSESIKDLKISDALVQTADGQLKPGEKTYLKFTISAPLSEPIYDAQIRIIRSFGFQDIFVEPITCLGYLQAGETREVRIPIRAGIQLQNVENEFNIGVYSGVNLLKEFSSKKFISRPFIADKIEIDKSTWASDPNFDNESLSFEISNPGDAPAKNVEVVFKPAEGITALSNTTILYPIIEAQSRRLIVFKFKKNPGYKGAVRIGCEIRKNNELIYNKSQEQQSLVANRPQMQFFELDGRLLRKIGEKTVEQTKYLLQLTLQYDGNEAIKSDQFKVLVNNREVSGTKMEEKKLGALKNNGTNMVSSTWDSEFRLEPGKNQISIQYFDKAGQLLGEYKQIVTYQQGSVNLHLISIGIKSDLRYTQNDAKAFAEAFKGQNEKLFKNVFISTLAEDYIPQRNILETFTELIKRSEDKDRPNHIKENDVLLVFISSHGKNLPNSNRFIIPLSDYETGYEDTRAISFEEHIMAKLNQVNCKTKLIFIDACHSGSAKELPDINLAETLGNYFSAAPGLSALASCGEKELSYEHEKWGHGAFTKGILEAFSNETFKDAQGDYSSDTDGNSIITLGELVQFLGRRVPQMVKTDFDPMLSQHPRLSRDELEREKIPLFQKNK